MKKYFTEALKELEHVVWPTNKEARNYFNSITSLITVLALFLFIIWTVFSVWLFESKKLIHPAKITIPKDYQKNLKLSTWSSLSWGLDLNDLKLETSTWTINSWTVIPSNSGSEAKVNTSTGVK